MGIRNLAATESPKMTRGRFFLVILTDTYWVVERVTVVILVNEVKADTLCCWIVCQRKKRCCDRSFTWFAKNGQPG